MFLQLLTSILAVLAGVAPAGASRTLLGESHSGILTFSPNCSASSYVCPSVHPKGAGVALNAVDFGALGRAACGKCVRITAPSEFKAVLPVSNIMTQGQSGDIDLTNHPLPTQQQCSQRYKVQWEYDDGPCP